MNNSDNLTHFTSEEASINGRKGGLASGESRRRKRMIKDCVNILMGMPIKSKAIKQQLQALGMDSEDDMTNQMAMVVAIYQKALRGDVSAFNTLRDTVGEKPKDIIEHQGEINNPYANLTEEELHKLAGE